MSWKDKRQKLRTSLTKLDWYLISGLCFLGVVLVSLAISAMHLHKLLNDAEALPIESVIVDGERSFTSDQDIRLALQDTMNRSFFSADIDKVQAALQQLPWVYEASVRREWPAKLKVYLQEQHPVAHWNGDDWLNVHGQVFAAPAKPEIGPLPRLAGPENMAAEVLTSYQQLQRLLANNGFSLSQLTVSPRHAWEAQLNNGIILALGREDKMTRVQRFIDVYPMLTQVDKTVDRIDLRYDTGLAVGWKETQIESR
ncbi:FtsQ-type POTRA domain-containing protein [Shewanella sp. SNU WT4]|uniref:cell division protein FtsQ/DivIB n=1 Tax=Shewanella sp. SNU WT4 TaxID=2590015 RepID=UPI00112C0C65|nr:cell division protein FtsQ/DivIB [Shewanella sp. SNU WT4]QDF65684.1 FtsQ-type POTRA domain-containing protein [Shewanella sp. SNU WT4]